MYGVVNSLLASFIPNPLGSVGLYIYLAFLTALIEWYVVKYFSDQQIAKRLMLANLTLIGLFGLSVFLTITAPQIVTSLGEVGKKEIRNPFFGLAVFIAEIKYAFLLFPLKIKKSTKKK